MITRVPSNIFASSGLDVPAALREPTQTEMFPVRAVLEFPDESKTADIWGTAVGSDGHTYFVKGERGGPVARASEWIVAKLAHAVSLPCPQVAIVQMQNDELLFGSRKIGGDADKVVTAELLSTRTVDEVRHQAPGLQQFLSSAYAFDLFVLNYDRHEENFVSVQGPGVRLFHVIDHARALILQEGLDGFPVVQNTYSRGQFLRARHGFSQGAAEAMLTFLSNVSLDYMKQVVSQMPQEWLAASDRNRFLSWWEGDLRRVRIEKVREGLKDGSLL
jgi:hypothetical protein